MAAILEVKALHKAWGRVNAVNNLSFSVQQGECFGLLGPNGAGKTTTIELMEGIHQPDAGEILFAQQPLTRQCFEEIGIQFQHTALMDYLKVGETIELYASFYKQPMPLPTLKTLCALDDIWQRDARRLSGGQRQRLLLALALVNNPKVVFLDEPTTGLDPQARRNFWQLIDNIKAQGTTILLTTHYMDEAQILCDRIAIIDQGQLVTQGAPNELLQQHFAGQYVYLPAGNVPAPVAQMLQFELHHQELRHLTDNIEHSLQQLLAAGVSLQGLRIAAPNLEDLFLALTGHELRS